MNSKRYPVQNYVPIKPTKTLYNSDLNLTLQKMTFDKIVYDPDYHFENSYISNFDLIHHICRGDELSYNRKHYETISSEKINEEIVFDDLRYRFLSAAIRSERKDITINKQIFKEHFNRKIVEEKLRKKCIFLSSMKKKAYFKRKTDDCKSLLF